jgi:hypothetical protein
MKREVQDDLNDDDDENEIIEHEMWMILQYR